MTTLIPLNQPSANIVLALINRDNNTTFTLSQVNLTSMTAMPSAFSRNTSIQIVNVPGGGFTTSSATVYYNRLDLAAEFANTANIARVASPVTTYDLLPYINETYGVNLTSDDVVQNPYTTSPHVVVAKSTSLVWTGQVSFTVEAPLSANIAIALSDELAQATPMTGFVYYLGTQLDGGYDAPPVALVNNELIVENGYLRNYSDILSTSTVTSYNNGNAVLNIPLQPAGNGWSGTATIPYHQIAMTSMIYSYTADISYFTNRGYTAGQSIATVDLLSYLNYTYQLQLAASDVNLITTTLTENNVFTVTATSTNYLLYGSISLTLKNLSVANESGILDYDDNYMTGYDGAVIMGYDMVA